MADEILPQQAPYPHAVLGWDGTNFRVLAVDGDGQLQIDVATIALPTGAATAAHQATQNTALQLLDNLVTALHSVGTDELDVVVETSALPSGAATAAHQVTQTTALQLLDNLVAALHSVGTDELDVVVETSALPSGAATAANQVLVLAQMPGILFNYSLPLQNRESELNAAAGSDELTMSGPAVDTIFVITSMYAWDADTNLTAIRFALRTGGDYFYVDRYVPTAAADPAIWAGRLIVPNGTSIRALYTGTVLNDNIYFDVTGFIMSLA